MFSTVFINFRLLELIAYGLYMEKVCKLRMVFNKNNGVLTSKDLRLMGYNYYSINKLLDEQVIERISRGKYMLHESDEDEYFLVQQIIPTGILCLLSAATIYNYTTFIPHDYHLAIKSNYSPSLPEYPPVKLYYWRKNQYSLGVTTRSVNGSTVRIYDKEKTVCDFLKFRNKLDPAIVKEVVKAYIQDNERDLVRLKAYSKALRIETVLRNYFEILL